MYWSVFKTKDLDVYADDFTGYINRLVEEYIATKTVCSFPNRKPWMNPDIYNKLREWSITFKSGDSNF